MNQPKIEKGKQVQPKGSFVGDKRTPRNRHLAAIATGVISIAALGAIAAVLFSGSDTPPPRPVQEFQVVRVTPPPPPPEEQQVVEPQEQEMIEQPEITEPEMKSEEPVEEPKEAPPDQGNDEPPPGPLGMDAEAEGPGDMFNLAGNPGGRGLLGGGGGGGSRWGWYASLVIREIEAALRTNKKTRNAVLRAQVRLWADTSGRVNRAQLVTSTGDPALDAVLRNEVLPGLRLSEPPPSDMPMPMVTRITARRPS